MTEKTEEYADDITSLLAKTDKAIIRQSIE